MENCDSDHNNSFVGVILNSGLMNPSSTTNVQLEESASGGSPELGLIELNPHNPDLLSLLQEWDLEKLYQHLLCTYIVHTM